MRLIYCPSESLLNQAEKLAKSCNLPIVIGENEFTKQLDFDRSIVQVVSGHDRDMIHYLPRCTVAMSHSVMCYSQTILDLSMAECIYKHIDGQEDYIGTIVRNSNPYFCERGYARFLTRLPHPGQWSFVVRINENDLVTGEVEAHETGQYRISGPRGFAIQQYF